MKAERPCFAAPLAELEFELPRPDGWPEDAIVRVDDPARAPGVDVIAPHVRLFADARMKELLVTPRGVRLVYQVAQAERAHYAVLRQLEFDELRLPADLVAQLLNALVALRASVASQSLAAVPGLGCRYFSARIRSRRRRLSAARPYLPTVHDPHGVDYLACFIDVVSIMDAYRLAQLRYATYRRSSGASRAGHRLP